MLSHPWMTEVCTSLPTDPLEHFPEWTPHRLYKASQSQTVDMADCHLLLHTMMIRQYSSIDHSQQVYWYLGQRTN